MGAELFWLLSFCGFAAMSLVCGLLAWPQLSAAWPSIEERIDRFRRQPPLAKVVLLVFVVGFIAYGSTKTNQVDQASGTNEVEIVEGGTNEIVRLFGLFDCSIEEVSPSVTPADIARGWQLWEVKTNCNISYAMPESAAFATNWWVRGAHEDVNQFDFGEWRFPFGSNGYSSVWALTWGKLRFALADTNTEIAAVGAPMSAVPHCSRLWSAADTNGSRLVTWENFALNRDTNTPVNVQIELRSTGDFIVRSNEVETVYRYIDDFDWDGDGIVNDYDWDPYWYDGDFTGQPEGWTEYVNESVGSGLENGYYKLTATFPVLGFRRAVLTVGYDEVVIAEPGEYVFLLEKGEDYEFDIEPFSPDVRFEVADDVPLLVPPLMLLTGAGVWMDWTMDGGNLVFTVPSFTRPGHCRWLPTFQVTPSANHLGPGDSPQTFTAVLTDYAYGQSVLYSWWTDDSNISFGSPDSESTTIEVASMPMWGETEIVAMATIGTNELRSVCHFTYGVDPTPLVHIDIEAPSALLLNSNCVDSAKIGQVYVWFTPDVETNGTLSLVCLSGNDKIRLSGETSLRVTGSDSLCVEIEGIKASDALDDVSLVARFVPDSSSGMKDEGRALTVVQVKDVVLPGAPDDGLVISTGTSVALDMEVVPSTAQGRLSTSYYVRRLRGNGTYTDWDYAAGNYEGTAAVYNPPSGGIYQVQALVGVGWGAEDERYYRWDVNENASIGRKKKGEQKAFGVCDEWWQVNLRNVAKTNIGSDTYAFDARVAAYGGFSSVPEGSWKCNIFVAHRLVDCGFFVPSVHHGRFNVRDWPPLANEWADAMFQIQGWNVASALDFPQPGYVAIRPSNGPNGHMGILDFDGMAISAQADLVTRRSDIPNSGIAIYRKHTEE